MWVALFLLASDFTYVLPDQEIIYWSGKIETKKYVMAEFSQNRIAVPVINGFLPTVEFQTANGARIRHYHYHHRHRHNGDEVVRYGYPEIQSQPKPVAPKRSEPETKELPLLRHPVVPKRFEPANELPLFPRPVAPPIVSPPPDPYMIRPSQFGQGIR
jgi:hypothetical protein